MEILAVSEFKATCLAALERVRSTGEPILITKRGKPLAEVVPTSRPVEAQRRLGGLASTAAMKDDLIAPATGAEEWKALSG